MNQKEWTIMIYMAGDNNLAVDMAYAMEQIKNVAAAGADSPNLFVYYAGNSRSILNFIDWCVNRVQVEQKGEISYGRRAEKYALIFSGHSLGFQDIGLFKDETSGKSMTMKDIYAVLERLTMCQEELDKKADDNKWEGDLRELSTKLLLGQPLDILGFDSCVMGMLEVGFQFSNMTKTMIASEGSVPSAGWTYAKLLGCLGREQNRNLDTPSVAELFVKQFIRTQDAYTVGGVSVDMAAWDLCNFESLVGAFDELAELLIKCFKDPASRIYKQME